MTNRIQNAIDIFLDAINKGTLVKGNCVACAVGNLVAAGIGGTITINYDYGVVICDKDNWAWNTYFFTCDGKQKVTNYMQDVPSVIKNIKATEFTAKELMQIEYTFETNTDIPLSAYQYNTNEAIRADQIKGLEAVVKVMLEFDKCSDSVAEVFTNKAELIAV